MNVFFEDLGLYKHVSILETLVLQAESEFQQENTLLDIIARWGKAGWKPEPPEGCFVLFRLMHCAPLSRCRGLIGEARAA